ncbi:MAG: molybdopterin-dependent oxidoreductase, partial [Streptosporangiaceae bacterium]
MTSGLLAGAVGVGVGYLVAGLTGPAGAPVVAVASLVIDLSPPPVKNFAISVFGTSDKLALQTGVLVILAAAAALIGLQAQRRLPNGMVGVLIFAVIGLTAAGTRPASTPADLLPTLAGAAAAAIALALLTRSALRVADATVPPAPPAQPGTPGTPAPPGPA